MPEMLSVAAEFQELFTLLGLDSCDQVVRHLIPDLPEGGSGVLVERRSMAAPRKHVLTVFFKIYRHARPSWRFWCRPSKARREYQNYAALSQLGIRCPRRVACGENRTLPGLLKYAFIATEAIEGAQTLLEHLRPSSLTPTRTVTRHQRQLLTAELARMTRIIHQAGFFHNDLVWRNILITQSTSGSPLVWWIDCPRGRFVRCRWRHHRRRIKDLASLDKSAALQCSRPERLAFLLRYLGKSRIDDEVRRWVCAVQHYRKKRWPDDWH
jgi:tRNA A-37 threonylcarbamoyl transferase component Bud32